MGQARATVSIRKEGTTPEHLAQSLAAENIFVWNGNFYAQALSEALGVEPSGGLLRIGLVHDNTLEEIDRSGCAQYHQAFKNVRGPP